MLVLFDEWVEEIERLLPLALLHEGDRLLDNKGVRVSGFHAGGAGFLGK